MEEKEIDRVLADDLQPGDLIKQDGVLMAIVRTEGDDGFVYLYTDDDIEEPVQYAWDDFVTIYGY